MGENVSSTACTYQVIAAKVLTEAGSNISNLPEKLFNTGNPYLVFQPAEGAV